MRLRLESMPFASKLEYIYGLGLLLAVQLITVRNKKYFSKKITQVSTENFVLCSIYILFSKMIKA